MFLREGSERDARLNGLVAGYLAFNAGFVNSSGFVLLGTFTSHVTGNVGHFGHDVALEDWYAALFSLSLVAAFFAGAFGASLVIEGSAERVPHAYGAALLLQSALLAVFVFAAGTPAALGDGTQGAILCAAMGMQNSLVTRLSGAVVRTTHLTGITTDLGIEAARWYRWQRERIGLPVLFRGRARPSRPAKVRSLLLLTIATAFFIGSLAGSLLSLRMGRSAMLLPALATLLLGVYALTQRKDAKGMGDG